MSESKQTFANPAADDIDDVTFATRLIYAGGTTDEATGAVNIPIYQTSTFRQKGLRGDPP
jgi:cystathionine beta-lyase/cystathionine gamma-synthase